MAFILAVLTVFILLAGAEIWWRRTSVHDEFSRKFVHITVGSFVAFWPYILSTVQIRILSVCFLVVVLVSKRLGVFQAIHTVQRPTWGEAFFAIMVGLLTFVPDHPHLYTAALLEMALADGLAAVIGTHYGKNNTYEVWGHCKSVAGSLAFFLVSCLILTVYDQITPGSGITLLIVPISLGATLLENVGRQGFDNLLVPAFIAACLYAYS